jgi:hypothetical protein
VLQLDDDVAALRLVIGGGLSPSSSAGSTCAQSVSAVFVAAATQAVRVLASLSELLSHPQAQEPLRRLGALAWPSSRLPTACLTTSSASSTRTRASASASSPSPRSKLRHARHCTTATRPG